MLTPFAKSALCLWTGLLVGVLSLSLQSGCGRGPKTAEVSGMVTYQGQPLPRGSIGFNADKQGDSSPILDGKYAIHRAPVGVVKVTVTGGSAGIQGMGGGKMKMGVMKIGDEEKGMPLEKGPKTKAFQVPAKYANPDTSGLTYEVKDGAQEKNFDLP